MVTILKIEPNIIRSHYHIKQIQSLVTLPQIELIVINLLPNHENTIPSYLT